MQPAALDYQPPRTHRPPLPRWQRILARIQVTLALAVATSYPLGQSADQWIIHFSPRFHRDFYYARFAVDDWANLLALAGLALGIVILAVSIKRPHPFVCTAMTLCLFNLLFTAGHSVP